MKLESSTAALALALLAVLAPSALTQPGDREVRVTEHGPLRVAFGQVLEVDLAAPVPARSLGLWWRGELGEAWLELTAPDGSGLGPHLVVEAHDLAPEVVGTDRPAGSARVSGLTHAYDGPATGARLTIVGPALVEDLSAIWIAPGATPQRAPLEPLMGTSKPFVYDRASWGAIAPQCGAGYCSTTHVALHHSASSSDFQASTWSQAASNVQSIQAFHMFTNGWCDVGYNYLISKQGWIFEGRAGGDDVKGAHDGKNCGSMGVCVMGYFHTPVNNAPTAALLDAFVDLAAWKCDQQGIDPLGSAFYAGLGAVEQTLYGHRDVSATACPGDLLYNQLPALRADVDAVLGGGSGPTAGTLKGVLYDSSVGTTARIAGGTVALADGTYVITGGDGYYEFPLSAGTYLLGATAPGFAHGSGVETVSVGDVWESIGLSPSPGTPTLVTTALGGTTFNTTFGAATSSLIWLGYAGVPSLPPVPFGTAGSLWPDQGTLQAVYLGVVPASGVLSANLTATGFPSGATLHVQGYVVGPGAAQLSNGAAWTAP